MCALRGKDYCNCEHAHMLRAHLELALLALDTEIKPVPAASASAKALIRRALKIDAAACKDLWDTVREVSK